MTTESRDWRAFFPTEDEIPEAISDKRKAAAAKPPRSGVSV